MQRSLSTSRTIVAILLIEAIALLARACFQLQLQERGFGNDYAADLSYLVVPAILAVLMFPILKAHKSLLLNGFSFRRVNMRLVLGAIAIGVFARLAWWAQLIIRIRLGLTPNFDVAPGGPVFSWACPPPHMLLLALLVWGCLVPVIEEVINRGLIQSLLMHRGRWAAVVLSACLFAIFHKPASIPFVFLLGIMLGLQFQLTRSLWATVISHASYDVLIIFDWRCLHGTW